MLTQLIENRGYEVTWYPLRTVNLRTLPRGVRHCAVVIGEFILFIVDPREQSSSSSSDSELFASGESSWDNAPDSDNVDPDFPENGYMSLLP